MCSRSIRMAVSKVLEASQWTQLLWDINIFEANKMIMNTYQTQYKLLPPDISVSILDHATNCMT